MTAAAPLRLAEGPSPPDSSMLIEASEAARLLGYRNPGSFRHKCAEQLALKAQAFHLKPPQGGNARWYVDRRYDHRLAPGAQPSAPGDSASALERFTRAQRDRAFARAACVRRLREARENWPGNRSAWIGHLVEQLHAQYGQRIRISRSSLLEWDRRAGADNDPARLVDERGGDQKSAGDPAAWDHFRQLYLDDRQPTLRDCWKRTRIYAQQHGLAWCAESSCRRQLNDRIPPEVAVFHRHRRVWNQQLQPGLEQHPEAWAAGECWIGDHAQLDLWCWYGRSLIRPWLTAWMDWRTRYLIPLLCPSPNSTTIMAALRAGILDENTMGGPRVVWIDNGKDYDAFTFHGQTKSQRLKKKHLEGGYIDEPAFQGIFGLLGIEAHFSLAHNPNGKARLERSFSTVHNQFDKTFPSYAGRSPDTKPESLQAVLNNPELVPTFEEVAEHLHKYAAALNARTDHAIDDLTERGGQAISPRDALTQWCPARRTPADPAALDLLLQHWHKPVRVTRNGIVIKPFGERLSYGQFDSELRRFKGLKAKDRPWLHVAYDPQDLSTIRIYDEHFRFITEPGLNDRGGGRIDQEQVRELNARKRRYRKALRTVKDNRELEYLTAAEVMERSQPEPSHRPPDPDAPPSLQVVQTPLDGQAKHVQRDQMRKAAGAEHDSDEPAQPRMPSLERLRTNTQFPPPQLEEPYRPRRTLADLRPTPAGQEVSDD